MYFSEFSDRSKVWIYQSNKPISEEQRETISSELSLFIADWSAHGKKLKADAKIIDDFRLVICTEGEVEASGCSIDASVRFIKQLGAKYDLNFFDRMSILVQKPDCKEIAHFSELSNHPNWEVYLPSHENLASLRNAERKAVVDYLKN